jgi:hypothetical protein
MSQAMLALHKYVNVIRDSRMAWRTARLSNSRKDNGKLFRSMGCDFLLLYYHIIWVSCSSLKSSISIDEPQCIEISIWSCYIDKKVNWIVSELSMRVHVATRLQDLLSKLKIYLYGVILFFCILYIYTVSQFFIVENNTTMLFIPYLIVLFYQPLVGVIQTKCFAHILYKEWWIICYIRKIYIQLDVCYIALFITLFSEAYNAHRRWG